MRARQGRNGIRQWMRGWLPLLLALSLLGWPASAAAVEPVVGATPTISDTSPAVDQVLTAIPGDWGTATLAYQWSKVSSSGKTTTLTGATSAEYQVQGADVGYRLKVTVTGSKTDYTSTSMTSATTEAVPKGVFTTAPKPTVSGTARVGMTLTADPGTYDPSATLTFKWYRGSSSISKATKATYTATSSDKGKLLKVRVAAARAGYVTVTQDSDPTLAVAAGLTAVTPVISDKTPQVGQTLSITKLDSWTPAPDGFVYQWYRGSTAIEGATSETYQVTVADKSAKLKVSVTGSKADYAPVAKTSSATSAVAAGVFSVKPVPTIAGGATVGQTVTVDEGVWTPTPDTFTYQWYRSGSTISGATARSYSIVSADAGKSLTVKVTAAKAGLTSASATSAAVAVQESIAGELRVATFNISGENNDPSASGDQRVWAERLPVVVSQIKGENPDVVGLQEAYQGTGQYVSLRNALNAAGKAYEISDLAQNASNGTRIMYNTATVTPLAKGAFAYANQVSGKTLRYLAWATFRHNASGKEFFFVTTHLSPDSAAVKVLEWKELIAKVAELNTGNLPVVAVGDFNTSKFMAGAEEMLPAMKAAGFGDVMNQQYQVNPPVSPRAEVVVNGWINSFNDYRRDITPYSYSTNHAKVGNGIDWVFATNSLRVKQWKVVIDFNPATLQINGVIPSDHNMISAVLVL